jgi:hypothetical protein
MRLRSGFAEDCFNIYISSQMRRPMMAINDCLNRLFLRLARKSHLPQLFSTVAKFFLRCVVLCSRFRSIGLQRCFEKSSVQGPRNETRKTELGNRRWLGPRMSPYPPPKPAVFPGAAISPPNGGRTYFWSRSAGHFTAQDPLIAWGRTKKCRGSVQ